MEDVRSMPVIAHCLEAGCDLTAVRALCGEARRVLTASGVALPEIDSWELVLAEAANNAVLHCRADARHMAIRAEFLIRPDSIELRLTDHTDGFDWPKTAELPAEQEESGRGLFLIQALTDESDYLRGRDQNCLVLRKARSESPIIPSQIAPPASSESSELDETRQTLELMTQEVASCYESLSAIFRFTAELQTELHSSEFIQRWLTHLLAITEADWFVLRLSEGDGHPLSVVASSVPDWRSAPIVWQSSPDSDRSVEARAATERRDVAWGGQQQLSAEDPLVGLAGSGCGFAHPLLANDALVGVLTVGRYEGGRPFQAGQLSVVQTFADFLGLQIRSRQLQEEHLRVRLTTRDLEIAAKIQRTLLPDQLPLLPNLSLAAFYRSAREVGGDYYDALVIGDGQVLLAVADVMGKGLPAALFAFMFRSLVRARRDLALRPGDFLAWLNQNLFAELDRSEMFITAQLVFLDCHRDELRVASAGHPPLLLADAQGDIVEVASGGPPLGILPTATFVEACFPFARGHALMFTDGLIEARNQAGDLLGLEAVKSTLATAARAGESSDVVQRRLVSLLREFEVNTAPADDTGFLVIASAPSLLQ